jgi:hypothetical protein
LDKVNLRGALVGREKTFSPGHFFQVNATRISFRRKWPTFVDVQRVCPMRVYITFRNFNESKFQLFFLGDDIHD